MAKTLATKRPVSSTAIFSNKEYDNTDNFNIFLHSLVSYATFDGLPSRVQFYITKNNNSKLTKENGLLNLNIPIIPACYDINSVRSLSDFVSNAKSPAVIQNNIDQINPDIIQRRIRIYANKMLNYIKNEIAKRYATAKKNNDTATMRQLSKLDVMKDFDLELYSLLLDMPSQIVENKNEISTQKNKYVLVYADGRIVPISKDQYHSINSYAHSYNRYQKDQQKFYSLSKVIEDYENYDITKELHESTVPAHSVIARGTSARTNNRVTKPNGQANQKAPSNPTPSAPKQFGEE